VMSSGAAIGAAVRIIFDRLHKDDAPEDVAARSARASTVASGLLGGESRVGVLIALVALSSMVIAG
ncbi:MAG: peptide transporter, partial [Atopobiaceae bacterium]|nr:peptide transporter [Atopobiaceae bacterium]